jgi:hypothetical protein
VKPAPFEYHAPDTLDEVLALLAEHGDAAKVLAGGQSLIPTMNFRLAQPAVLVDLNGLVGLSGIEAGGVAGTPGDVGGPGRVAGGAGGSDVTADTAGRAPSGTGHKHLTIGAMTRQRAAERSDLVRDMCPLLHETMPHIAHPQIRNRGTVGGSVAHADPAAELPAVMLALDAALHLRGGGGARTVPARDFFTGLFATALAPDEVLVSRRSRRVPARRSWRSPAGTVTTPSWAWLRGSTWWTVRATPPGWRSSAWATDRFWRNRRRAPWSLKRPATRPSGRRHTPPPLTSIRPATSTRRPTTDATSRRCSSDER